MALFKRQHKSGEKVQPTAQEKVPTHSSVSAAVKKGAGEGGSKTPLRSAHASVLINPRITEKATLRAEAGVYTFNILPYATKVQVKEAVKSFYNVSPIKVRVVSIARKRTFARGKRGVKSGGKKAYVYLKEGDNIEFV